MVSSGLAGSGRVSVSQYRLAFHLTLASAIYAAVLWTAQQIAPQRPVEAPARLRYGALAVAVLVLLQIYLGALVAGLDAGLAYNTWPLIDGSFVPAAARLLFLHPAWRNFFENMLTVQFDHRMVAYTIFLRRDAARQRRLARGREVRGALILAGAVTLQLVLGIVTLLHQAPIELALAHQMMAILVFTVAVVHAERLWHRADMLCAETGGGEARHDRHANERRRRRGDHAPRQGQRARHRVLRGAGRALQGAGRVRRQGGRADRAGQGRFPPASISCG